MASKKNNKKKTKEKFSLFQWIDKIATKHWFFTSFFVVGASWWFSLIITFFGEYLKLVNIDENGNKSFTLLGIIFTILAFLIIVVNTALSKYRKDLPNKTQEELTKTKVGFNLLDKLFSNISRICDNKLSTQIKKIENIKMHNEKPPIIYSNPCNQFETILKEIVDCLSFVLSTNGRRVKAESIYASIAYNFPEENKDTWQWADVQNQKGLDLESLLKNGTTFFYLLNNPKTFEFFNSKQNAVSQNKYVPDEYDKYDDGKLAGSIFCYEMFIKRNDVTYVRAILSVTTYDTRFVEVENIEDENQENIINTKENIRQIILSEFEKRIKIELCNYYVQFLRNKWDDNKTNKKTSI